MPPKNKMLAAMEEKYRQCYEDLFHARIGMVLQIGQDAGCMAANDTLKMGQGRAADFCLAYRDYVNEIVMLIFDDQKDDKDFVYARAKIDERLEKIVGKENFLPCELRYGLKKEGYIK
jgi:hypothetical protein